MVLGGIILSGLVHEIAISVPAKGGYGLPTLYFALQGAAMLIERAAEKRGIMLTSGIRGWCWTASDYSWSVFFVSPGVYWNGCFTSR